MTTRKILREVVPALVGVAGLLVVWAVVATSWDSPSLPSPAEVWGALVDGLEDGSLAEATALTLVRLAFSFVVAVVVGTALGLVLALSGFARRAVRPLIVALQITPFVAWVPLAVIWFGVTERAVVFVAIVGAFPSMTLATIQAVRQVPPLYPRVGRTLGAEGWTLYRRVIFPAALPGITAGIQQAWGFAWKALMAGELILAAAGVNGLGHTLAREGDDVAAILATLAVIVAIGVAADYLLFGSLDRRIRRKRGLLVEA